MPAPAMTTPAPPTRSPRPPVSWFVGIMIAITLVALAVLLPLADRDSTAAPAALDPATLVPEVGRADITADLPQQLDPAPAAGTAVLLPGPFTARVAVAGLALEAGERAAAVGTVQITQDVSTLIVMELEAGFYDEQGQLLGTERLVLRQPDSTRAFQAGTIDSQYNGALPVRIEAPDGVGALASSAVVSLPVVVNE